ncbi:hypothetical protein [Methanoculleus chikugoensis]|uniref:hypothetical protein n=1 Tax=Methanoculleus chikugoensis TaxID=118126 RepID=UPI001FB54D2D|nr:hypothetical protein [Methanoculleus chikugoensis]
MAITVDEGGISGYRDPAQARAITESMGVPPWVTATFADEYGITLDEIVGRKGTGLSCSYCGVLRRALMNRIAREHGVTKFAYGFNLDDEAQSVLMNALRGGMPTGSPAPCGRLRGGWFPGSSRSCTSRSARWRCMPSSTSRGGSTSRAAPPMRATLSGATSGASSTITPTATRRRSIRS